MEKEYNNDFKFRMPKQLHKLLAETAEKENVSLNQFLLYLVSMNYGKELIENDNKKYCYIIKYDTLNNNDIIFVEVNEKNKNKIISDTKKVLRLHYNEDIYKICIIGKGYISTDQLEFKTNDIEKYFI